MGEAASSESCETTAVTLCASIPCITAGPFAELPNGGGVISLPRAIPMKKLLRALPALVRVGTGVLFLAASAGLAQAVPRAQVADPAAAKPVAGAPVSDEALAKAAELYYSSSREGLAGFDCAVHPDWRGLFLSANPSAGVAESEPRVALLKSVKITVHVRTRGRSTLDWEPPATPKLGRDLSDLRENMRKSTEQALMTFLSFWTCFVNGAAEPPSSQGLTVTSIKTGYRLEARQGGTTVTEEFDFGSILRDFRIRTDGTSIDLSPSYAPTDKGLLVTRFLARIQPDGTPPERAEQMRVSIEYNTLAGFPIPSRLEMELAGTGAFNFQLDNCAVTRQTRPEN